MRDEHKTEYYSSFEQDHRTFGFSDHETNRGSKAQSSTFRVASFAVLFIAASLIMIALPSA